MSENCNTYDHCPHFFESESSNLSTHHLFLKVYTKPVIQMIKIYYCKKIKLKLKLSLNLIEFEKDLSKRLFSIHKATINGLLSFHYLFEMNIIPSVLSFTSKSC